jgi:hypothetical protein
MWAAVAIGLGLGLVLFLHGLATQVAPYSPRYFDQLSGYFALYRSHAVLTDPTQGVAQRLAAAAPLLLDQRGWSVPLVATGLGLVFGASRLAFAATNYVFLAAIVAALAAALSHRFGVWAAAAGIGLLLTSRSLYLVTGGLHDLRMDLAGLATFGIFVLALWGMAEAPDRRHVALAALAYAVTTWSRSVTGVYGLGAIGLFWAVSLAAALRVGGPCWSRRWRAAFALGLAASAIFALFAGLHLEALDNYYGNLLRSDELRIRLAEFGVSSRAGLLGYFLASGWDHLRPLVLWAGVALAALAVLSAAGRWLRPAPPLTVTAPRPAATPALLTVGAAVVGTLVPLSLFSPSPVVIGVLTVPLALLGATALARAAAAVPWPRTWPCWCRSRPGCGPAGASSPGRRSGPPTSCRRPRRRTRCWTPLPPTAAAGWRGCRSRKPRTRRASRSACSRPAAPPWRRASPTSRSRSSP